MRSKGSLALHFKKKKPLAFKHTRPMRHQRAASDEAWRQLLVRIDKTAARVTNVPKSELDALIDEAVDYVRHHPAA
jgi:hypothetical protein